MLVHHRDPVEADREDVAEGEEMSTMIRYVKGDATRPDGDDCRLIVHCCNNVSAWGAGFSGAVSRRWAAPEADFRRVRNRLLGSVSFVPVDDAGLWVANLIGQDGIGRSRPRVRYEAIKKGLATIATWCDDHGASVHMPRIGTGLAGGRWSEIEPLIERELLGIDVTVYDLP